MSLVIGPTFLFETLSRPASGAAFSVSFDSLLLLGVLFSPAVGCALLACLWVCSSRLLLGGVPFWSRLLQYYFVVVHCSKVASSTSNATTRLAPRRDHWFAVRNRVPQYRSLQQRGLLFMRSGFTPSGLGDSLPLRFVGGLQQHCVILWAVSTFFVRFSTRPHVTAWPVGSSNDRLSCSSLSSDFSN